MKYDTYMVGNVSVNLRLTSSALVKHCESYGEAGQNPLVCVVDALDNLDAKISILTKALNFPGNQNTIKNGSDLLDMLADEDNGQDVANEMILQIARTCGQLTMDDMLTLRQAVAGHSHKLVDLIVKTMRGEPISLPGSVSDEQPANPTTPSNQET